jgi:hypothetical protein
LQFRHRPHHFTPRIVQAVLQLSYLGVLLQHLQFETGRALLERRIPNGHRLTGDADAVTRRPNRSRIARARMAAPGQEHNAKKEGAHTSDKLHAGAQSFNRVTPLDFTLPADDPSGERRGHGTVPCAEPVD